MRVQPEVGADRLKQVFGVYGAAIHNNQDPEGQWRCQLKIPQLLGTATSNWAERVMLDTTTLPVVGTYCLAMFIGGDINRPLYMIGEWEYPVNPHMTNLLIDKILNVTETINTDTLNADVINTGVLNLGMTPPAMLPGSGNTADGVAAAVNTIITQMTAKGLF